MDVAMSIAEASFLSSRPTSLKKKKKKTKRNNNKNKNRNILFILSFFHRD